MATLADALRHFGAAYMANRVLSTPQAKAWRAIVACRTAALGGQQLACDSCGHSHWQYHSCRNRHCPQCQTPAVLISNSMVAGGEGKDCWMGRSAGVWGVGSEALLHEAHEVIPVIERQVL